MAYFFECEGSDSYYFYSATPSTHIRDNILTQEARVYFDGAKRKEIVYPLGSQGSLYTELFVTSKPESGTYRVFLYGCYKDTDYSTVIINNYSEAVLDILSTWDQETRIQRVYNYIFTEGLGILTAATMESTRATYKPKIKIYVNDIVPMISNISPQSGYINTAVANQFSWSFSLSQTTGYVHIMPLEAGAEVEWKTSEAGEVHTLTGSTAGHIDIPADTFAGVQTVVWRVRVKTDDNIFSAWSEWFTLSTQNAPGTCIARSPMGQYLDSKENITFSWESSSPYGNTQTDYEALICYESAPETWVSLFSGTGSESQYILPANTLSGGNMKWKIRSKDTSGSWSEYSSELSNSVVAPPSQPVINAVGGSTSRPTITWQVDRQLAFELIITQGDVTIYNSGIINSVMKQHKIPVFLGNGQYLVKVRSMDEYNLMSEYGVVNAFISADKPDKPSLAAEQIQNGVRLSFSGIDETATQLIVYRGAAGGKKTPIAALTSDTLTWDDYSSVGEMEYFLRVAAGDLFEDSDTVSEEPIIQSSLIAAAGDLSDIAEIVYQRDGRPVRNSNYNYGLVLTNFEGRKKPCAGYSSIITRVFPFIATFKSAADLMHLQAVAETQQTVLYRDETGRKLYGSIDVLTAAEGVTLKDININIMETDYSEAVEYD